MATLYRNATTFEYFITTEETGEPETHWVHPDGANYLLERGIDVDHDIPADALATLRENGWLTADDGVPVDGEVLATNESETGFDPVDRHDPHVRDLPTERLEPRPWMEQENVDRFREETDPTTGNTGTPARGFTATPPDRENAQPLAHPEDTASARGVWFWVLVVAVVLIAVWVLFEVM